MGNFQFYSHQVIFWIFFLYCVHIFVTSLLTVIVVYNYNIDNLQVVQVYKDFVSLSSDNLI